jgi:hypothetical protein
VQAEFADGIEEEYEDSCGKKNPSDRKGCPFLCKKPDGNKFACAIYPSRPPICREFLCYRMLISHTGSGEVRGRVIGKNELLTGDEVLRAIWNEKIVPLPHPFTPEHVPVQHTPAATGTHMHSRGSHGHVHANGHGNDNDREWVARVVTILASNGYRGDPVE